MGLMGQMGMVGWLMFQHLYVDYFGGDDPACGTMRKPIKNDE